MNPWIDAALLLLLTSTAAGALLTRDLIGAVFILSCYSFALALNWAWLGAADVAFTEAVVGAGLSTVFFLLALFLTSPKEARSPHHRGHWLALGGLIALALLLLRAAKDLPRMRDPASAPNAYLTPVYLQRSLEDTLTPNVVTSILMDYRALDTLIETAVIFTASIGCALLLRRED